MQSSRSGSRILIIEDDRVLGDQLADMLTSRGFQTDRAYEGESGLVAAFGQWVDLILLDVLLPGMSGFDVLEKLRRTRDTPVVMLTACGAEEERVKGFRHGADDYVPKPFSFTELLLRIEALLRRTRHCGDQRSDPEELIIGDLRLSRLEHSVCFRTEPIELTAIQFRLLWMLALHQGEVLTKPYLYRLVLEKDFSRYDRSLDMHLSRVRRKLAEVGVAADRLQTVHGQGYCFL